MRLFTNESCPLAYTGIRLLFDLDRRELGHDGRRGISAAARGR